MAEQPDRTSNPKVTARQFVAAMVRLVHGFDDAAFAYFIAQTLQTHRQGSYYHSGLCCGGSCFACACLHAFWPVLPRVGCDSVSLLIGIPLYPAPQG